VHILNRKEYLSFDFKGDLKCFVQDPILLFFNEKTHLFPKRKGVLRHMIFNMSCQLIDFLEARIFESI
jgi:hypothetical protein